MEIKKSKKADLEGQKGTSLLLGYIVALGLMFAAFEWTTHEYKETDTVYSVQTNVPDLEEIPPITQPIFTAAPPPPANVPQIVEIIDIVDDKTEIKEEKIESQEDTHEATPGPVAVAHTGPVSVGPAVENPGSNEDEIFPVAEQMPTFPGGDEALFKYLSENIKYPPLAIEQGIQGKVIVQFVVNKDGSIVDPKVVRSLDPSCDKEALRVIKNMPKWNPGRNMGRPVRVKFTAPVSFRLS